MHNVICHNVIDFSANMSLPCWNYVLPSRLLSSASDSAVFLWLILQFHLRSDSTCYTNLLTDVPSSVALCGNQNTLTAKGQCLA
jgi:hypothetical protein